MVKDNKVIDFKSAPPANSSKLPLPLLYLRDSSIRSLARVLAEFFDCSDDSLFNMADKAHSDEDRTAYFNAMRELRLNRKRVSRTLLQWVARAFNRLGKFDPKAGNQELTEAESDSLTLMDSNQLEQSVALENLTAKFRNRHAGSIHALMARVSYLLPDVKLEDRQMPLSPEVLCSGLEEACGNLEIDIRAKLVIFKLFERLFIDQLDELYDEANQLLKAQGILPQLKHDRSGRGKKGPSGVKQPDGESGREQQLSKDEPRCMITFSELSTLLRREGAGPGPYQRKNASHWIDTGSLMARLGKAQRADENLEGKAEVSPLGEQLQQVLVSEAGQPLGLQDADGDVINLVSMLFDFILEDRQLPAHMKALIGRLQIPVLKVALCDRDFFNRGGHPARKLLNELARAGIGWIEKNEGQRDPLREKMEAVVGRILNEFTDNVELFAEVLEDFNAFIENDRRRRKLIEKRLTAAEEGRARQDNARRVVDNLLTETLVTGDVPKGVESLLLGPWHSYLQWVILREGEDSKLWSDASALTATLVWSVNPRPQEAGTRNELLRTIPGLVGSLRSCLQSISWDAFALDGAIRDLELSHVDVLQRLRQPRAQSPGKNSLAESEKTPSPEPAQPVGTAKMGTAKPAPTPETGSDAVDRLAAVVKSEPRAEAAAASPAEPVVDEKWLKQVEQLRVGAWLERQQGSGQLLRCKLAAFIKATGRYIFVNRNGAKVAEYSRDSLARAFSLGDICLLDDGLIFDRALESIINNLRQSRDG